VPSWGSYSYLFGPLVAFALVGVFALLLRWAFSHGHSVVAGAARRGRADEYGLLVVVASPETFVEAEVVRRRLQEAGITATLAPTTEGPRVMVFPRDEEVARAVLGGPGDPGD
jgi:hypothetical protein